jgi:membrane protein required for colicin V production
MLSLPENDDGASMNTLDIIFLALLILLGFRGLFRGLALEFLSIGAVLLGLLAARHLSPFVAPHLAVHIDSPETVEAAAALVTFLLAVGLVWVLARILSEALKFSPAGPVDRGLGAAFGLLEGYAACCLLLLAARALAPQAALVRDSSLAPFLLPGLRLLTAYLPDGLVRLLQGGF